MFAIRKKQLKFMGQIMKPEGLENLTLTGYSEGIRETASNLINEIV